MPRFTGGWFKLHRSINNHIFGGDAVALAIFIRIVGWANVKQSKIYSNGAMKFLERGQLLTTLREISESFALEPLAVKTVERKLKMMEIEGAIVQQVTNHGRVITICNYEKYQDCDDATVKQLSNQRQTSDKRTTNERHYSKEIKNIRNKEGGSEARLSSAPPNPNHKTFVDAYFMSYEKSYGTKPLLGGKDFTLIKGLLRDHKIEDLLRLLQIYFNEPNDYYRNRHHPIEVFKSDLNKLNSLQNTTTQATYKNPKELFR